MDIIRKVSNSLGTIIATINEEDEEKMMETVMDVIAQMNVRKLVAWLSKGLEALPEDVTLMDLMEDEEKYDEILDKSLNVNDLFSEEELAELEKKFGKGEEEPD